MERLHPEEVIVKMNMCQKCDNLVTVAVKHTMDTKSKNKFLKEVMEYNLSVQEQPLIKFKESNIDFCSCE